jgi:CDGSH-type Zn-finger protein
MPEPNIASKSPKVATLEPGDYWWCSCGYSQKQPFCDGSHQGKGFTPKKFTIAKKMKVALCNCKYAKQAPFCDGTHTSL